MTANHTTEIDAIRRALGPGLAYAAAHAALDSLVTALTETEDRETGHLHDLAMLEALRDVLTERAEAAERRAQEAERDAAEQWEGKAIDRLKERARDAEARADALTRENTTLRDALVVIEDTEWGDAAHEANGPNEIARAALSATPTGDAKE